MEARLDIKPVMLIHRDKKGYVCLLRKNDEGKISGVGAVRVEDYQETLPAIRKYLYNDGYFTVNSFCSVASWNYRCTGLPGINRKELNISRLNTCYVDIDCGRPGVISWMDALPVCERLMENDKIPQASMYARSGRGLYLFWLLIDEADQTQAPKMSWNDLRKYKALNRAFQEILRGAELPVDNIHDGARFLRLPGSIHTTVKKRVAYIARYDESGNIFRYTIKDLLGFFNIPELHAPDKNITSLDAPKCRQTNKPGSAPDRIRGYFTLHRKRVRDLLAIEQWRGGFLKRGEKYPDGFTSCGRRFTLSLYAQFLRGSGITANDAKNALLVMAKNTKPPYPSDGTDMTIEEIIRSTYTAKPKRWRNSKLLKLYGINDEVARDLELETIIPEAIKLERKAHTVKDQHIKPQILKLLDEFVKTRMTTSCRRASRYLKENGFNISHETTRKYILELYPKNSIPFSVVADISTNTNFTF